MLELLSDTTAKILAKPKSINRATEQLDTAFFELYASPELMNAFTSTDLTPSEGLLPTHVQAAAIFDVVKDCFVKSNTKARVVATLTIAALGDDNADFHRERLVIPGWALKSSLDGARKDVVKVGKKKFRAAGELQRAQRIVENLRRMRRLKVDFEVGELPQYQMIYDNGGLAYLVDAFDEWCKLLMNLVRINVNSTNLSRYCIANALETIKANAKLGSLFVAAYRDVFGENVFSDIIERDIANGIAAKLILKVCRARSDVVVKNFKENNTGRTANKAGSETIRAGLKQSGVNKAKEAAASLSRKEKKTAKKDKRLALAAEKEKAKKEKQLALAAEKEKAKKEKQLALAAAKEKAKKEKQLALAAAKEEKKKVKQLALAAARIEKPQTKTKKKKKKKKNVRTAAQMTGDAAKAKTKKKKKVKHQTSVAQMGDTGDTEVRAEAKRKPSPKQMPGEMGDNTQPAGKKQKTNEEELHQHASKENAV
jgi:hypothetical protein